MLTAVSLHFLVCLGDHIIYIKYNEQNVSGSPYTCKVFDVDKVSVSNMPKTYEAGKYIHFDSKYNLKKFNVNN